MTTLERERRKQQEIMARQAREARERVERAAREAGAVLRKRHGEVERQVQAGLGEIRKAEAMEQRKRDLPLTIPIDIRAKERISEIERLGAEATSEVTKAKVKLEEAKAKDIAAVEEAVKAAEAELEKAYEAALAEQRKAEAERRRAEREYKEALAKAEKIEDFIKDDKLNLTAAVTAGFTKLKDYPGFDVKQSDIDDILEHTAKVKETQLRLKDFIEDDKLDLTAAVAAGFTRVKDYFGWDVEASDIDVAEYPPVTITTKGVVIAGIPSETEGEQAFNQLLIEGRIPSDSKYVSYDKETLEVTYESPMAAPTLDYTGLEEKFLKESESYQQRTMVSAGIGTPYGIPIGIPELGLGRPGDYRNLTNEEKLRALDAYAVLVSPIGGPSFPFPIAGVLATKVYPWTPSAAIARLGPEASFGVMALEAAKYTVPAVWLLDVKDMKPWQIAVNAGIDIVFLGSILGPRAFRMITRGDLKATTTTARASGKAQIKMTTALAELRRTPVTAKTYPRIAAKTQAAVQASMKADRAFIDKLLLLKDIRPGELVRFQKLSRMPGLKDSVVNINKAVKELDKAWKGVEKYPIGSEKYIKGLASVEKARLGLDDSLTNFYTKTKPRHEFGRYAGWEDVITKAEREVAQAQQAANNAAAAVGKAPEVESLKLWLRDAMFDLRNAEVKLSNLKAAEATGEFPPQLANPLWDDLTEFLKKEKKPLSPEGLKEVLAAKERLEVKPKPWEAPRERVAVAVKEKIEVKPAILKPKVGVRPEVKPAVPKVKPSVFPGLTAPKVKVTTPTETKTVDATELGRMTPEKFQELYGTEVMVEAIGKPIPLIRISLKDWMSPREAIEAAQRLNVELYAKQIEDTATNAAIEAINKGLTEGAVRTAAEEAVKTQTRTIVDAAVRARVKTLVGTRLRTKLRTIIRPLIHIPPTPPAAVAVVEKVYPAGTAVWKQGAWWKIIPPPYTLLKPISSRRAPAGVTVLKGTPQETLTFLEGKLPFRNVAFDLGVTDGYIDVAKKRIVFRSDWQLKTDVGRRLPSTTKGISLEEAKALGIELPTRKKRVPKKRRALGGEGLLPGLKEIKIL